MAWDWSAGRSRRHARLSYDFDALGSTVGLTGAAANYVNHYSYLPFGEPLTSSETVANPFEFVGQYGVMHEDNGLDFMRARYYSRPRDVSSIRIPSASAAGRSTYTYMAQNPVNWIDPTGLDGDLIRRKSAENRARQSRKSIKFPSDPPHDESDDTIASSLVCN